MTEERDAGGAVLGYAGRDGRRRVTSGGPWEARYGYGRALVAGFAPAEVVRTRMYVVNPADVPVVAEAHARWLGEVRPAATLAVVAGLIDRSLRVEIEADARRR